MARHKRHPRYSAQAARLSVGTASLKLDPMEGLEDYMAIPNDITYRKIYRELEAEFAREGYTNSGAIRGRAVNRYGYNTVTDAEAWARKNGLSPWNESPYNRKYTQEPQNWADVIDMSAEKARDQQKAMDELKREFEKEMSTAQNNAWKTRAFPGQQIPIPKSTPAPWEATPNQVPTQRPNYTKTEIKPPSETVCIQFIGGPKNSEQLYETRNRGAHQTGNMFVIAESEPLTLDDQSRIIPGKVHQFLYKLTLIPENETPFSDAQIVIALFQG